MPGIYTIGDVKGGPAFTHISYDDYRVAAANVLEGKRVSIAGRMVPVYGVYRSAAGADWIDGAGGARQGKKIRVAKMAATSIARALESDESRGLLKVIVDAETEQILGAAMMTVEGGEMASMIQIAMMGKLPYTALRDGVWSHPTWSEALNNVFFNFEGLMIPSGAKAPRV